VPGLTGVTAIAAGAEHACAVRMDGTVLCWGAFSEGQLGLGHVFTAQR
jgi:alpha-tubulin suppressor-like RCC1 family protein